MVLCTRLPSISRKSALPRQNSINTPVFTKKRSATSTVLYTGMRSNWRCMTLPPTRLHLRIRKIICTELPSASRSIARPRLTSPSKATTKRLCTTRRASTTRRPLGITYPIRRNSTKPCTTKRVCTTRLLSTSTFPTPANWNGLLPTRTAPSTRLQCALCTTGIVTTATTKVSSSTNTVRRLPPKPRSPLAALKNFPSYFVVYNVNSLIPEIQYMLSVSRFENFRLKLSGRRFKFTTLLSLADCD